MPTRWLMPKPEDIPAALRERRQWVLWRAVDRGGKPTKQPFDPKTRRPASTTDPTTWSAFGDAWAALEGEGYDGIGYVFSADDPFTGIDLDKCRDPETGVIESWARAHVDQLSSYTEISPSGTGLHIIVRGKLPPGRRRRGTVEMYDRERYFAITGHALSGAPPDVQDRTDEVAALHAEVFGPPASHRGKADGTRRGGSPLSPAPADDEAILARARRAKNGAKFTRLFDRGDRSGYTSPSEADLALCSLLAFFCDGDAATIDRLFRRSHLMRLKWDSGSAGGTYGSRTIATALRGAPPSGSHATSSTIPTIRISDDLPAMVDAAIVALGEIETPRVFQRARSLVVIAREGAHKDGRVRGKRGRPYIYAFPLARLRELLRLRRIWLRLDRRSGDLVPALPPMAVVEALFARGEWNLPVLEGVAQAPVLLADGSLLQTEGFHGDSGLYLDFGGTSFPVVPEHPTAADVEAAKATLLEPLSDFPFASDADRAAAMAAILTPLARFAIAGPVPLCAIRSPTPGSGKGLVANVVSIIATGRFVPVSVPSAQSEEMRKNLLAIGIEGHPIVLFDNVSGEFGSNVLAAAITSMEISDRLLGASKQVCAPLRPAWMLTGNNVCFVGDMGRRVYTVDLDPKVERPEEREGFKHKVLLKHVRSVRPELVAAGLTILRYSIVMGPPSTPVPTFGSFEEWSAIVRSAVIRAMGVDPLARRHEVRDESDSDVERIADLHASWLAAFGSEPRTLSQAAATADTRPDLRDALSAFDRKGSKVRLSTGSIGNALKQVRDRVVHGRRLERLPGSSGGSALYRVVEVAMCAPPSGSTPALGWSGGSGGSPPAPPAEVSVPDSSSGALGAAQPVQPAQPLDWDEACWEIAQGGGG